jgi:exosortase/archaeosortase family protein
MSRPSVKREQSAIIALATAGVVAGASAAVLFTGLALAYISLILGVIFFAFAARYYVATISVLLAPSVDLVNGKNGPNGGNNGNGSAGTPMISVHIAVYNEERVIDRVLTACSNLDYPNYEVIVVDDSHDGTVGQLKEWILRELKSERPKLKIIHRENREGFKGGALNEALRHTSSKAEYIVVFDADFVPEPDILRKFLAYFNKHGPNGNGNGNGDGNGGRYGNGRLAAVQGYQWHTLNRSENWLTRGVSCEFSGSYMVDRTFQEVAGVMKMVAGSVYMVRADLLRQFGWSSSITEDWELTLRLYENGYKVLYTPLIQAPAECPSTLGKLVRQRMRWAEGHTFNVKKHFSSVLTSTKLGIREKLEFLYFAPYYLQSVFLIVGTFAWLTSDILLGTKLPFWTAELGWALVITNLLALPLMSLAGLFLEKRAGRDLGGLFSQLLLIYALSPYQAYASLKGLVEPREGSWVRTFKSGRLAGFPGKLEPRKVIRKVLPPKKRVTLPAGKVAMLAALGVSVLFAGALVQGQLAGPQASNPAYYFYDEPAPASYSPFPSTTSGTSFLMHLSPPTGPDASVTIGSSEGSGPVFFSDPATANLDLPTGASVSVSVWVNSTKAGCNHGSTVEPQWTTTTTSTQTTTTEGNWTEGYLNFKIEIYDPTTNSVIPIGGADETEVLPLQQGVELYQASWGYIAQGGIIQKGETLVATIWCTGCRSSPTLLFNSPAHPSSIDFPIEVPENSISLIAVAVIVPGLAGIVVDSKGSDRGDDSTPDEVKGLRRIQGTLIIAAALIFLTLPLVLTFGDLLASLANATGFDRVVSTIVPFETAAVGDMLRGFGLPAGSNAGTVWLGAGFVPVTAVVDWNCSGWQSFALFGLTSVVGLEEIKTNRARISVLLVGLGSVLAVNILRIFLVVLLGYYVSYPAALIFHDYGGALIILAWLFVFWVFVLRHQGRGRGPGS